MSEVILLIKKVLCEWNNHTKKGVCNMMMMMMMVMRMRMRMMMRMMILYSLLRQNSRRQRKNLKSGWSSSLSFSNPWTPLHLFSMWPSSRAGVCLCLSFVFTHHPLSFVSHRVTRSSPSTGLLGGLVIMFTSLETIEWRKWVHVHTLSIVCIGAESCSKCVLYAPQCAPPGCLIELCIQLSMIMLGKQLIQNNVFEVLIPYVFFYSPVLPCDVFAGTLSLNVSLHVVWQ